MSASEPQAHKATHTKAERVTVFALIGAGHTMSHLYMLTLPPLFFLIKAELAISYTALGLLVTVFHVATGAGQVPAGYLVDRIGARATLTCGMFLIAFCMGGIGVVDTYWAMLILATVAGFGNSAFHPSDYAILAAAVDDRHLGKAFGFHLLTGNLGFAAAPILTLTLAELWDWQTALVALGAAGAVVGLAMTLFGRVLRTSDSPARKAKAKDAGPADNRVLTSPPVLMMLVFFVLIAVASTGVQSFSVTALITLFGVEPTVATQSLTIFLATGVAGVAVGGFIADKLRRPVFTVGGALLLSAVALAPVGIMPMPTIALFAAMGLSGLLIGVMRPARDVLVNAIVPPGATGRVFGFVAMGISAGAAVAPVGFGWLIDLGAADLVFPVVVAMLVLSVVLTVVVDRMKPAVEKVAAVADPEAAE